MSYSLRFLVLGLTLCAAFTSTAQVTLYDTITPGFNSDPYYGNPFDGSLIGGGYKQVAGQFTPAVTASLSEIDVVLGVTSGTPSALVTLYSSSADDLPGTPLISFQVNSIGYEGAVYKASITDGPVLSTDSTYWLSVAPIFDDTNGTWCETTAQENGQTIQDNYAARFSPDGDFMNAGPAPAPAMELLGTPEPGSMLSLAGLSLVVIKRKVLRRRNS